MEANFYGHIFALYMELNSILDGRQQRVEVDSGRYIGILTDVIVFLYNRGMAGSLGPVSEVFLELGKCVTALFKMVDSPELQCFINFRVRELEMMMLMDESVDPDDDVTWAEKAGGKVEESAEEKVEEKVEEKCQLKFDYKADNKFVNENDENIDEKCESVALSDEEIDESDYETGDETEGETGEEDDTTVTSDESDNTSNDVPDCKSSWPGVPTELEIMLKCLTKYLEVESF